MSDAARGMAECCRRLADIGLIVGAAGNISVRLAEDRVLVTPSGLIKADLGPEDMVEVDLAGGGIRGRPPQSAELGLRLQILRSRGDVTAVIHAQPRWLPG